MKWRTKNCNCEIGKQFPKRQESQFMRNLHTSMEGPQEEVLQDGDQLRNRRAQNVHFALCINTIRFAFCIRNEERERVRALMYGRNVLAFGEWRVLSCK